MFTGTILRSRALFQKIHGQVDAFTGTFWDFFTGTFRGSRAENLEMFTGTFRGSRALFPQKYQKCRNLRVHGHFSQVHGHFFLKMFTGTFEVHGHFFGFTGTFLGSRARFFSKVHGQLQMFTGTFAKLFTGTFSRFTGKKTLLLNDIPVVGLTEISLRLFQNHKVEDLCCSNTYF